MTSDRPCAKAACIVETHFVNRIAMSMISGSVAGSDFSHTLTPEYRHDNGFDPVVACGNRDFHAVVRKTGVLG